VAKGADVSVLAGVYGGPFRLTSIIQKRMRELVKGARPLVEVGRGRHDLLDIVLRELEEGRIEPTEEMTEPAETDIFQTDTEEEEGEEEEAPEEEGT